MSLTIEKNDPFLAVRIKEYRNMLAGRFLFIIGLRMMSTLVGWWIYNLTNAPFAIGLIDFLKWFLLCQWLCMQVMSLISAKNAG